jgi:hypothetical protein
VGFLKKKDNLVETYSGKICPPKFSWEKSPGTPEGIFLAQKPVSRPYGRFG